MPRAKKKLEPPKSKPTAAKTRKTRSKFTAAVEAQPSIKTQSPGFLSPERERLLTAAERHSEYMNNYYKGRRAAARDIEIPPVCDPERREACEADTKTWLKVYLPHIFRNPWTIVQERIIEAIDLAAVYGGDKAIAAPRGSGKTAIGEGVILSRILRGLLRYPVICASNGKKAAQILKHIKEYVEQSETLIQDYPEVCAPIIAMRGNPILAGRQTVNGELTRIEWLKEQIRFPTVEGSVSSGAVVMTVGMDAAIRGLREGGMRPDFVLLDDPETRESAKSEVQTETRRLIIEEDLAGLAAGDEKLGRLMLTTIMRRATEEGNPTLSFEYTDRESKPSWDGDRYKALEEFPSRMDMWDEYVLLRNEGMRKGDKFAREAHKFYLENFDEMNRGSAIGNPYHFVKTLLPDGSQTEVSGLQKCFNIIADRGLEHFKTEYNNDPPTENAPIESGITSFKVQSQVSGLPRKLVPEGTIRITQGIDVRKISLHYTVRAWLEDGTGHTIDYGVENVYGTKQGTDEGVGEAIKNALSSRRDMVEREPYYDPMGQIMTIDMTLVDAGWKTEDIYDWVIEAGVKYRASMGFGKSNGCVKTSFSEQSRSTQDKRMGQRWFLSRKRPGLWLLCFDADFWKGWEHDHWMKDAGVPGCLLMWGTTNRVRMDRMSADQKAHFTYAKHICAEVEVEEVEDNMLKRYWKAKSDTNHYLDSSVLTDVAATMVGVPLIGKAKAIKTAQEGGWFVQDPQKSMGFESAYKKFMGQQDQAMGYEAMDVVTEI